MVINSSNINNTNNHLNWTHRTQNRPRHMTLEIQIMAWDRHTDVAGLNNKSSICENKTLGKANKRSLDSPKKKRRWWIWTDLLLWNGPPMTTITNSCSFGASENLFNISISKIYDIYIGRTIHRTVVEPMTHYKNALPQNCIFFL